MTHKEAPGMAATLPMFEDIGALHDALKISAEYDTAEKRTCCEKNNCLIKNDVENLVKRETES